MDLSNKSQKCPFVLCNVSLCHPVRARVQKGFLSDDFHRAVCCYWNSSKKKTQTHAWLPAAAAACDALIWSKGQMTNGCPVSGAAVSSGRRGGCLPQGGSSLHQPASAGAQTSHHTPSDNVTVSFYIHVTVTWGQKKLRGEKTTFS